MKKPNSIYKGLHNMNRTRIFAMSMLVAIAATACAGEKTLFADKASTETRWKLSPEARVTSDTEYNGSHYGGRMKFFLADNKTAGKDCIVFLGDSITDGFPLDLAFNGPDQKDGNIDKVVNRGISGDHIEGMIQRLDVCVRDLQPQKVYVMAGTNDIWWVRKDYTNGNVKQGYERLAKRIRELSPKTEIIFQTILPINATAEPKSAWDLYGVWVKTANDQIREVAKANGIKVIDTNKAIGNENGYMIPRYTLDGIHLNMLGYLRWIDELDLSLAEKAQVWRNLSGKWRKEMVPQAKIAGKNRQRWDDELIMYTPDQGTTCTGTNAFGVEVMVQNDKVTSIGRTGNMPVPKNGYVLSGHNKAGAWLINVSSIGAKVKVKGNEVDILSGNKLKSELAYEAARGELLVAMANGKPDLDKYLEPMDKARKGDEKLALKLCNELKKLNTQK